MKNLFVIPSYNMNSQCYDMVCNNIKLLSNYKVVIIDNNSTDRTYLNELEKKGIKVIKSKFNGAYEPGALLQCYEDFAAENYFVLQDSINILDPKPFIDYCETDNDHVLCFNLFFPAYHMMSEDNKQRFNKQFSNLRKFILSAPGVQYNSFVCKRHHLDKISQTKVFSRNNLPSDKIGSQNWERVFGMLFYSQNINLKTLNIIYDGIWSVTGKYNPETLKLNQFSNIYEKTIFGRQ